MVPRRIQASNIQDEAEPVQKKSALDKFNELPKVVQGGIVCCLVLSAPVWYPFFAIVKWRKEKPKRDLEDARVKAATEEMIKRTKADLDAFWANRD